MTSNITDLIQSTFYLTYNANIQPSEVDKLTTHEMREFINLTRERLKMESESNSNLLGAIGKSLGIRGKKRK